MRRVHGILITGMLLMILLLASGCGSTDASDAGQQEEIRVYALVTKAKGNPYNDLMAEGFEDVIDIAGGNCLIVSPGEATAEAQIECIEDLIGQGVDSITVAANDADALSSVLQEAMNQGIAVSTVDSDVAEEDRLVFVNQVSVEEVARTLVDAVYDLTGGEGQWAILSTSSQAANQNAWIDAMRSILEEEKYRNLRLVDIEYGNDESEASGEATLRLLADYPELEVICAPTVVGLLAAAETVSESENRDVKVTGLGLPSEMAPYITGEDAVCPCMYLWDPVELGSLSAYVAISLTDGTITGTVGEVFRAGDMGYYEIQEGTRGGSEVIAGTLLSFDADNIDEWKDLF